LPGDRPSPRFARQPLRIATQRLDLVPLAAAWLQAAVDGNRARMTRLLDATLPPTWPDLRDVCRLRLAQILADPSLTPWLLRAMILRSTRQWIGHIGFHTGPDPEYLANLARGGVEFGYTVFEPFRRQGYAREAAEGLMQWARTQHGIRRFVVSIRPDNTPSLALAARLGFRRIGEHVDPVDGPEDILCREDGANV